jgi:hypothetical protein
MNFISSCLSGEAFMDEIDDYVERWHSGLAGENQELHEFLGMSWEEYSLWATRPSILESIINSRIRHISLDEELNFERVALAASTKNNQAAVNMEEWLKKIGKIEQQAQ